MMGLSFVRETGKPLQILCLGCHADDIEIGCGGTILRLAEEYGPCELHWVVLSACGIREAEARRAASLFAGTQLLAPLIKTFRDGFMPFEGAALKEFFETDLKHLTPDIIFTHYRMDAHQDHRTVSELTWNTFRNHLILEYEIPKYDGDLGQPNLFIPLDRDKCEEKVGYMMDSFKSQQSKKWFDQSTFMALMRLRGMECNSPSGFAEAFYCRKVVV